MIPRVPESCPHRVVRNGSEKDRVDCRYLAERLEESQPTDWQVCEACCRYPLPEATQINPVLASFLYQAASRRLRETALGDPNRDALLKQVTWSEEQLLLERSDANSTMGIADIVDRSITAESFAQLIALGQAFVFARYGDGEWMSIWGESGCTSDNHDLMPDTLGGELRDSLHYFASISAGGEVYVGTVERWHEREMVRFLFDEELTGLRWVTALLLLEGLGNFQTKLLLEAIGKYSGRKLLVGNATLAPVARAFGMTHVHVPMENCYYEVDVIEARCRFDGPGLLVFCAGMATECLIMRLHRRNPEAMYLDAGHIFDAMVGRLTRDYTQQDIYGLVPIIEKHYQPMLHP